MEMKIQLKICFQVIMLLCSDVATGNSPTSQITGTPISHTNLIFEILLAGVEIDQDNNIVLLDKEMASMRSGQTFLSQINDNIPKNLLSVVEMVTALLDQSWSLTQIQFETIVLTMVYSAHQARKQESRGQQEAWGEVLVQLANITVQELRGHHLIFYE
ncbi:protein FAM180A [Thalassophryne amazonica]|uniref:protein FAM180A n=1 Tax=Thalassophryne amazonica TaxID=390379 RepID=UPI00147155AD|nr:protein FAM180A [Thalassophryne amazonica]